MHPLIMFPRDTDKNISWAALCFFLQHILRCRFVQQTLFIVDGFFFIVSDAHRIACICMKCV